MLQREVPLWLAVILIVVVVLVVVGIYWLRMPRTREGASPPPGAPIYKFGPMGKQPPELEKKQPTASPFSGQQGLPPGQPR
jgi:uncharacterized membrane protein YqiK